jgi:DNA polymerase-3 subunit epsilon
VHIPVVWSPDTRRHLPRHEVWVGVPTPGTEVPERVDAILDALAGHPRHEAAPHGDELLERVHGGELLAFLEGAELVIHNAAFDVAFMDAELARLPDRTVTVGSICRVLDTLALAREMHPGQRNTLDALCKRYGVDNSRRELHGAQLDAQILLQVYLSMTGGQAALSWGEGANAGHAAVDAHIRRHVERPAGALRILQPSQEELGAHEALLQLIAKASGGRCLWLESVF